MIAFYLISIPHYPCGVVIQRETTDRRWDPELKLWVFRMSSLDTVKSALEAAGCDVDLPSARIMEALSEERRRHEQSDLGNDKEDRDVELVREGMLFFQAASPIIIWVYCLI